MVRFGQIVMGPPGSGKTTYCESMRQFMEKKGRTASVINLDPANENLPSGCSADIQDLVSIDDVMEAKGLGPNGALLYAMDFLGQNLDWLRRAVEDQTEKTFLLIDLPGQVELLNNSDALPKVLRFLTNTLGIRLVAVHLVDSLYCADAAKFLSVLLSSLATMVHLELPHINVLSKLDLAPPLPLPLEAFTEAADLSQLLRLLPEDDFTARHRRLSEAIASVVGDWALLRFLPLSVRDLRSVEAVLGEADRANGFCYGDGERTAEEILSAAQSEADPTGEFADYIKEHYCKDKPSASD